jgi:hypothetical protein
MSKLEEVEKRRAERKAKVEAERNEQRAVDLEAIEALEIQHGDSSICMLEVPYTPGLPNLVAARCPNDAEVKRYRASVKPDKQGRPGNAVAAAEQLAALVRVYPDDEAYAAICAARPGIHAQLGATALGLAVGKAEDEGKG